MFLNNSSLLETKTYYLGSVPVWEKRTKKNLKKQCFSIVRFFFQNVFFSLLGVLCKLPSENCRPLRSSRHTVRGQTSDSKTLIDLGAVQCIQYILKSKISFNALL